MKTSYTYKEFYDVLAGVVGENSVIYDRFSPDEMVAEASCWVYFTVTDNEPYIADNTIHLDKLTVNIQIYRGYLNSSSSQLAKKLVSKLRETFNCKFTHGQNEINLGDYDIYSTDVDIFSDYTEWL